METSIDRMADEDRKKVNAVEAKVIEAYKAVFDGRGSLYEANTVLMDLMRASGWGEVLGEDATHTELATHNGGRRVMGRILYALTLPREGVLELQRALQRQPVETYEDGSSYEH